MKQLTIFAISFCFLLPAARASEIVFDSDVKVKRLEDNSFIEAKAGSAQNLSAGESILVITPRGLPMLIQALSSGRSKTVVTDANLEAVFEERTQTAVEKAINTIVDGVRKAEVLIQKKDYTQARTLVNDLKDKYPKVSSVLFMSGTIHYLLNNKTSAIEDLEKGLQIDSQNESARKLLAQMRGAP